MKNKLLTLFQVMTISSFFAVSAFGANAGGPEDPLATKSYVDKCIREAMEAENISESVVSNIDNDSANTYKAIQLEKDKVILGGEGTEIILRSGIAFAYITGIDSILDVTSGTSIIDKNSIAKDHLIIIPRNDGRGMRASEDSWLLVKGSYEIIDYSANT